ncbi:unnamed protein product, partial [Effrenium voratum]
RSSPRLGVGLSRSVGSNEVRKCRHEVLNMGARCCTLSQGRTEPLAVASRIRKAAKTPTLKTYKEFQDAYSLKGPVRPGATALAVSLKELGKGFVCRKLKKANLPCKAAADVANYCQNLSGLEHPHICRFIEAFEDTTYIYMIYERAGTTTLFELIRERASLTEEDAADYLRQAAMALSVAHSQGIVHGRLSPKTLIVDEEDPGEEGFILRPALFSCEETPENVEMEHYACSPEYVQKELVVTGTADLPRHAEKNDIWALGMIFFHMLSGSLPFQVTSRARLAESVGQKFTYEEAWGKLSASAREIVEQMLRVNPAIRISASTLLKHPWIKVARTTFPRRRMVQLLNNLRLNVQESELKRFVLRVIAEQLPRDSKTEQAVEKAFRCLDRNGDGVLTVEEVVKGLKKHLEVKDTKELESLFAQVDRDGSGTINVQEFLAAAMDQNRISGLPILWEAFSAFDKDRGGTISNDEIGKIVKEVEGQLVSMEVAESCAFAIQKELEQTGNSGDLDFEQFVYLMKTRPSSTDAANTQLTRACWAGFGMDCYQVRHREPERWDITKEKSRANRSVYRHRRPKKKGDEEEPVTAG